MILGVFQFFWILNLGASHLEMATTVPMIFIMLTCFLLERIVPYDKEWKPNGFDWKNDALHLILFQTIFPKAFKLFFFLLVIHFIPENIGFIQGLWPHHWPLLLQAITMMFISDFFRYWIHRLSHTVPFLWRFHAVHHALTHLGSRSFYLHWCFQRSSFIAFGIVWTQWFFKTFKHRHEIRSFELYHFNK
ncbi:MAG: hypothetical protein RI989_1048 [Bacteroidota bacterium]